MPLLNVVIDLYHGDEVDDSNGFHAIRESGILAVIHKATDGVARIDETYIARRRRAKSLGLLWGSYHFGRHGSPVHQADHYLSVVDPIEGELICLDFEAQEGEPPMTRAEAEAFVERVNDRAGRYPTLYTGQAFIHETLGDTPPEETALARCPLWIARYSQHAPELPPAFATYVLWQYTGDGQGPGPHTVPGVGNSVDRSKFNGTPESMRAFWGT
jgi:lysozyme